MLLAATLVVHYIVKNRGKRSAKKKRIEITGRRKKRGGFLVLT
jgi:hypothetical protein